jgi:integrase
LIFTGCRRNEALTATWSDIDFGKSMWNRPAIRQKGKKNHSVPLAPQAAALLLGIRNRQVADGIFKPDGYVFASSISKTGHVTFVRKAWARVFGAAALTVAEGRGVPIRSVQGLFPPRCKLWPFRRGLDEYADEATSG